MKKIVFFAAIVAAAGLASCTSQAPKANLKSEIDSLSYMIWNHLAAFVCLILAVYFVFMK